MNRADQPAEALAASVGLTYRQVDHVARWLWPELSKGSGISRRRVFDRRQVAVLDFYGRLFASGLFSRGSDPSRAMVTMINAAVVTGDETQITLDGGTTRIVIDRSENPMPEEG